MTENPNNIVPIMGDDDKEAAKQYIEQSGRELVTILFTDLVDSTQMQSDLGNEEAARITVLHRELVREELKRYEAREIEWAGDSCLAVFTKPSDAVVFALRMQAEHRVVRKKEKNLPKVRVGIHLGEIVVQKGEAKEDLFGLQVSETARVMSIARGDQIFCTRAVYDSARSALKGQAIEGVGDAIWVSYGHFLLKGSDDPVEVCEIGSAEVAVLKAPEANDKVVPVAGGVAASGTPRSSNGMKALVALVLVSFGVAVASIVMNFGGGRATNVDAPILSLAVLPFDNNMGDDTKEYYVDGMTDTLTAELSKIGSIKVIARTSAMRFKNSELPLREIAAELGVDGLIEGSVQQFGEDLRITAQLIDGRTEEHLWGENFDGTFAGVMKLQGDVAVAIADNIGAVLTPEERTSYTTAEDVEPAAWDAYIKGREAWQSRTVESFNTAIAFLESATTNDPEFADAHGVLALVYASRAATDAQYASDFEKSEASAKRALSLDSRNASAHFALVWVNMPGDWNWAGAVQHLETGLSIDPNHPYGNLQKSLFTWFSGHSSRAIEEARHAVELDPFSAIASNMLIQFMFSNTDYEGTVEMSEFLAQRFPDFTQNNLWRAFALAKLDRFDEALEVAKATSGGMAGGGREHAVIRTLAFIGQSAESNLKLDNFLKNNPTQIWSLTGEFAALGRIDEAIQSIREGVKKNNASMALSLLDSHMGALWERPEFWDIYDEIGWPPLPPEHAAYPYQRRYLEDEAAKRVLAAQPKPVTRFTIELDESEALEEHYFSRWDIAWSSDGTALAHVAGRAPSSYIALKRMNEMKSTRIEGTGGGDSPFFSPDGEWIVFVHTEKQKLMKVPVSGGEPIVLCDTTLVFGVHWGGDNHILFGASEGIWRVSSNGGTPELIEPLTGGGFLTTPQYLPDGRGFIYSRSIDGAKQMDGLFYSYETNEARVFLESGAYARYLSSGHLLYSTAESGLLAVPFDLSRMEIDGDSISVGEEKMSITGASHSVRNLAVSGAGNLAYFVGEGARQTTRSSLVWVGLDGTERPALTKVMEYMEPSLSPDGRYLATTNYTGKVTVTDLKRGIGTVLNPGTSTAWYPIWTPDGKRIVFTSYKEGLGDLYWKLADGTGEMERLTSTSGERVLGPIVTEWTPDGNSLVAIIVRQAGTTELKVFSPGSDEKPKDLLVNETYPNSAAISANGEWIAYSASPSGRHEIFIRRYPEMTERTQISAEGGIFPIWAPDGNTLYFRSGTDVMSVPIEFAPTLNVGEPEPLFSYPYRGADLESGNWYALSPDGQEFLMMKPEGVEDDERSGYQKANQIRVVLNWLEEVKRLAPLPEKE